MTAAAIRGTFSDMRTVKGRKVLQIVIELPIEEADAALRALGGVPRPDDPKWVAIARLNENAVAEKANAELHGEFDELLKDRPRRYEPEKPRKAWADLPPSQQSAMRCGEPEFAKYLEYHYHFSAPLTPAEKVRELCGVKSRKEFDTDHRKRVLWHQLDQAYLQSTGRLAHG